MSLPDFETPRLLLRPRCMEDFDACLAMDRDPDVTRYIQGPWADPEKHRRFVGDNAYGDGQPCRSYVLAAEEFAEWARQTAARLLALGAM